MLNIKIFIHKYLPPKLHRDVNIVIIFGCCLYIYRCPLIQLV